MPGTSTTTIRPKAPTRATGISLRQKWYGTLAVISRAPMPSTVHTACLTKYVHAEPSVWSASTEDADSTMTRPSPTRMAMMAASP